MYRELQDLGAGAGVGDMTTSRHGEVSIWSQQHRLSFCQERRCLDS